MRVAWTLKTAAGHPFQESAYFTPYELARFDPATEGFGDLTVDLTPRQPAAQQAAPVSAEEGRRLSQLYGCAACHAVTADAPSGLGPTWKGLYGSQRSYAKGVLRVTADDAYLRESILEPTAKVVTGYERGEAGMPSYAGVLCRRAERRADRLDCALHPLAAVMSRRKCSVLRFSRDASRRTIRACHIPSLSSARCVRN
jgi:hypothetical protein